MFISLDLPPAVKQEVAAWGQLAARANRGLKPIRPEAIHLTLAFLGSMPAGQTGAITEAIERSARAVGEIESGRPIWLPRRRPRALVLELKESGGTLDALRTRLIDELRHLIGWRPESSGFLPHLTVARAGRECRPAEISLESAPSLSFDPVAITLYRSHLDSVGARYEGLHTVPINRSPGS